MEISVTVSKRVGSGTIGLQLVGDGKSTFIGRDEASCS